MKKSKVFIYGVILACIAALVIFLFQVSFHYSHLFVWEFGQGQLGNPPIFSLIICSIGGVVVGVSQQKLGRYPKQIHQIMAEFKVNKRVDYYPVWHVFISALLVLLFGAALGPEAALFSIGAGMVTWVGDKLRFIELAEASGGYQLSYHLLSLKKEVVAFNVLEEPIPKKKKVKLYTLCVVAGTLVFSGLNKLFRLPSMLSYFGKVTYSAEGWKWLPLLLLAGVLFGSIVLGMDCFLAKTAGKWRDKAPLAVPIICGIILGIVGSFVPYTLFSGEDAFVTLVQEAGEMSIILLLAIAFGKSFLTKLCLQSGWLGGQIFPSMFVSVAFSLVCAKLIPLDPLLVIAITAPSASCMILKGALFPTLVFLPFFSASAWPLIVLSAGVTEVFRQLVRRKWIDK